MELYVIRHAIAEPLGKHNEFSDEKRSLTDEGRDRLGEITKGLRRLGVQFDLLLTSPLTRAIQTAEIIATAFDIGAKEIQRTANLAPGASAVALIAEIKSHTGVESVALVGHQPDLGVLVSGIIGSAAPSLQLKKGGVCCVNVTETVPVLRGDLVWLLTPKQLRLLARA
jgi:phosphohistidine phosphatase